MQPRVLLGTEEQRKTLRIYFLSSTDWYSTRQRDQLAAGIEPTLTDDQWQQCLAYRQALRDWPATGDYNEPYPVKPEWM